MPITTINNPVDDDVAANLAGGALATDPHPSTHKDQVTYNESVETAVNATIALAEANEAALAAHTHTVERTIGIACSDESTAISATGTKATIRMPYAMNLTGVRASLTSPCTTGTFTADINEAGVSILSTKLTIDAGEKTSTTAATPPVLSDVALADDAEITVDVDVVGDGTATGLKITLIGTD